MNNHVSLSLPQGAKVIGALRTNEDAHYLDKDMLSIELSGSIFITVGWYPELDLNGKYIVNVFRESFDSPLQDPYYARTVGAVKKHVESIVKKYEGQSGGTSYFGESVSFKTIGATSSASRVFAR